MAQRLRGQIRRPSQDELAGLLAETRAHDACARRLQSPDFQPDVSTLNADWSQVPTQAIRCLEDRLALRLAGRVREQVAGARVGVRHLLCQTGFGAMNHEQNMASMRRFGEQVMPVFRD